MINPYIIVGIYAICMIVNAALSAFKIISQKQEDTTVAIGGIALCATLLIQHYTCNL